MSAQKIWPFQVQGTAHRDWPDRNAVGEGSSDLEKDVRGGGPVQPACADAIDTITIRNIVTFDPSDSTVKVTGTYTCAAGEATTRIIVYVVDEGLLDPLGNGAIGWAVLSAVTCNGQPQSFELTVPSTNGTPFGLFGSGLVHAELQTLDRRGVEVLEFVPRTSDVQNVTIVGL
ncbi:hypothetical protein DIE19_35235 [Burkholderia sp. Bp9126]|nr:hypothetical protein DIE19_35235 [Burkholderia sp. Bp9126]